jgi:ribosome-associated protein
MRLSRSEQKRRIKEVEKQVQSLLDLPRQEMKKLPCNGEMRQLFLDAHAMKGGARKRQIKYITRLLSRDPVPDLSRFLSERKGKKLARAREMHELEYLRDSLLDEAIALRKRLRADQEEIGEQWPSRVVEAIEKDLPGIDSRALLRLAAIFARTRQARHSRELFRLLRAARECADRQKKMRASPTPLPEI